MKRKPTASPCFCPLWGEGAYTYSYTHTHSVRDGFQWVSIYWVTVTCGLRWKFGESHFFRGWLVSLRLLKHRLKHQFSSCGMIEHFVFYSINIKLLSIFLLNLCFTLGKKVISILKLWGLSQSLSWFWVIELLTFLCIAIDDSIHLEMAPEQSHESQILFFFRFFKNPIIV